MFVGFSRCALLRGIGPYVAEIELSRLDWLVANGASALPVVGNLFRARRAVARRST